MKQEEKTLTEELRYIKSKTKQLFIELKLKLKSYQRITRRFLRRTEADKMKFETKYDSDLSLKEKISKQYYN